MTHYYGPVADAHIHLWDLTEDTRPWLSASSTFAPPELLAPLRRDYLPDDYRRDIAGTGVVAAVHVEALWSEELGQVGETQWLESLDHVDGVAVRYVAGVPFGRADTGRLLEEQAEFDRVKAVRQVVAWDPVHDRGMATSGGLLDDPAWLASVDLLSGLGLHLELLLSPWQCARVAEIARERPSLMVIVDHIASPVDQSPAGIAAWKGALEVLAACPNVVLKVSSVGGYLAEQTPAAIADTVRTIRSLMPADRLMFGSDFPVGALIGVPYSDILDACRAAFSDASPDEQADFFYRTAARSFAFTDADVATVPAQVPR